ncbi:hypothetical protein L198_06934 [Cryptococcus wingfieldii CBS 7118]|uniref:Uncharacterized protein n=1 Tax=Cryptococcus wingfieldii CBS 7118 TaxID=1295528 RepID=A0A1E3IGP9_9TREE|nr:hypothetical protein L198_06934 [Cryptococcus wingfieldii CBS 7118]ODN87708.1 hypothetical protein L198_06934 [Cryptococcus wingfieldii CBS 7118]
MTFTSSISCANSSSPSSSLDSSLPPSKSMRHRLPSVCATANLTQLKIVSNLADLSRWLGKPSNSDEVHFHVPKYLLMASSAVLKDMLSLPAGNESQNVELSDRFLENSSPIAFYLSLLVGENGKATLEKRHQGNIVKTCHAAILLAVK